MLSSHHSLAKLVEFSVETVKLSEVVGLVGGEEWPPIIELKRALENGTQVLEVYYPWDRPWIESLLEKSLSGNGRTSILSMLYYRVATRQQTRMPCLSVQASIAGPPSLMPLSLPQKNYHPHIQENIWNHTRSGRQQFCSTCKLFELREKT